SVYFVAADQRIHRTSFSGSGWSTTPLDAWTRNPIVAGLFTPAPISGPEEHVFYIDLNGKLRQSFIRFGGGAFVDQSLPGAPVSRLIGCGSYYPEQGWRGPARPEQHVYFRGLDGSLQHSWWNSEAWDTQRIVQVNVVIAP